MLIFLVVSAINLAMAKQFTDNGKAVVSDSLGGLWQWMVVMVFLIRHRPGDQPARKVAAGGS